MMVMMMVMMMMMMIMMMMMMMMMITILSLSILFGKSTCNFIECIMIVLCQLAFVLSTIFRQKSEKSY